METTYQSKPLAGIRILELSNFVAAPSCGRILAYLGAEVTKIENLDGEPYRTVQVGRYTATAEENPVFDALNAGKQMLAVNLKTEEGIALVRQLLERSDVFFSNVRAKSLKKLGLDYESVHALNPKLVYAHFSGYGEKGPLAAKAGYDSTTFFARSGLYRDFVPPSGPPSNHNGGLGDLMSGLSLTIGILGALMGVRQGNDGCFVSGSLIGVSAWSILLPMIYEQYGHIYAREYEDPLFATEISYECSDGEWIFVTSATEKQWIGLTNVLERPELQRDPRFDTYRKRIDNASALYQELKAGFLKKSSAELQRLLDENDVPAEINRHIIDNVNDVQLAANDDIYSVEYPSRTVCVPIPPFHIHGVVAPDAKIAAPVGADTELICRSLGYEAAQIRAMQDNNVIR